MNTEKIIDFTLEQLWQQMERLDSDTHQNRTAKGYMLGKIKSQCASHEAFKAELKKHGWNYRMAQRYIQYEEHASELAAYEDIGRITMIDALGRVSKKVVSEYNKPEKAQNDVESPGDAKKGDSEPHPNPTLPKPRPEPKSKSKLGKLGSRLTEEERPLVKMLEYSDKVILGNAPDDVLTAVFDRLKQVKKSKKKVKQTERARGKKDVRWPYRFAFPNIRDHLWGEIIHQGNGDDCEYLARLDAMPGDDQAIEVHDLEIKVDISEGWLERIDAESGTRDKMMRALVLDMTRQLQERFLTPECLHRFFNNYASTFDHTDNPKKTAIALRKVGRAFASGAVC